MRSLLILGSVAVIAVLIVSFGLFGLGNNGGNNIASVIGSDMVKVRVADLPVVHALPLYIAMEKGYFDDAGIEIEYNKLDSPNIIIDALLSGQVDITSPSGAMGIAGIASFRQPGELEIYAATGGDETQRTESLVVLKDSGIKSFADLNGKKMGILPGIQWRTISQHLLMSHGLTTDDVTLVELAPGLQIGALAGGQIDALLAIEPMATIAEEVGMREVVHGPNLSAISNPFYPGAGIVRSDFVNENPEVMEAFIGALSLAIEDMRNNPDEARKYLSGYTPLTDELVPVAPIMVTKLYNEFDEEDVRAIETLHKVFTAYEIIDGEINTRGIIYMPRK